MYESPEALAEIAKHLKGRTLLVERHIGLEKFNLQGVTLRVDANSHKYPTRENVIPWEKGVLRRFVESDFGSIILQRLLYRPIIEYVESPVEVLIQVKRILAEGGVLVVNSYLLNDTTSNFSSAETFHTEEKMRIALEKESFTKLTQVKIGDALLFVCEK